MLGPLRCLGLLVHSFCLVSSRLSATEPVPLGTRRELVVDDRLIEQLAGQSTLRLHHPEPSELALETSEPWEGNATYSVTVFPTKSAIAWTIGVATPHTFRGATHRRPAKGIAMPRVPTAFTNCHGNASRRFQEPATDSRGPTTAG